MDTVPRSCRRLHNAILKYADENPSHAGPPVLEIDAELQEQDLTMTAYDEVLALEPYGVGNTRPIFAINEAQFLSFKAVGDTQQHLQIKLMVGDCMLDTIGFSMGYLALRLDPGKEVSVAGELMVDTWNGTKKLKMRLIDVHFPEAVLSEDEPAIINEEQSLEDEIQTEELTKEKNVESISN